MLVEKHFERVAVFRPPAVEHIIDILLQENKLQQPFMKICSIILWK